MEMNQKIRFVGGGVQACLGPLKRVHSWWAILRTPFHQILDLPQHNTPDITITYIMLILVPFVNILINVFHTPK